MKIVPLNVLWFFNFPSNENKTDCYMSKSNQFRVCELISLFISLMHRYILQVSWNYPTLTKHSVCYNDANCLHILCRSYTKKTGLFKYIEPSVWLSTARTWTRLNTLHGGLCSRTCIALWFPAWTISMTKVRTCWENFDQQIIDKSIDHWRDKLKAVVRLNDGHIEQLFWLSGSFTVMFCYVAYMHSEYIRAFCHCLSSVTMVLWQKVNLANN